MKVELKKTEHRMLEGGYDVLVDGRLAGVVRKMEDRTPEYARGHRYVVGYSVSSYWSVAPMGADGKVDWLHRRGYYRTRQEAVDSLVKQVEG